VGVRGPEEPRVRGHGERGFAERKVGFVHLGKIYHELFDSRVLAVPAELAALNEGRSARGRVQSVAAAVPPAPGRCGAGFC
jgi:hypothetical protein